MYWDITNYNLINQKYIVSDINDKLDEVSFDIPFNNISYATKNYLKDIYRGTLYVTEKNDGTKLLTSGICSSTGEYLMPNYMSFYGVSSYVSKTTKISNNSIDTFNLEDGIGLSITFSDGTSVKDLGNDTEFYLDNYQSNNYGIVNYEEIVEYIKEKVEPINYNNYYPISNRPFLGYVYDISIQNEGGSFSPLDRNNILIEMNEVYKIKIIENPNDRIYQ